MDRPVAEHPEAVRLLERTGLKPAPQLRSLRGIADQVTLYAIP